MIPCPHCDRELAEANDAFQHIKIKHGAANARRFRHEFMPAREQSIGAELVDAMISAEMGEDVPEHIALMFPDEVADARRRGREYRR